MQTFYYVNTGHRIGLDRFRRASAIIKELQAYDITLLSNDFRIASISKEYGFKKGIGIDVVRNIPHIAQRGDQLIVDSNELSPTILEDMQEFFSTMIRFCDDPSQKGENIITTTQESIAVDRAFEKAKEKKEGIVLFFGDDDYEEDLLKLLQTQAFKEVDLLMGFYYFFDYDEKLAPYVKRIIDEEAYFETISEAKLLITSSFQAALEASVAQVPVVYFQRADYDPNYETLLKRLGILCVATHEITQEAIRTWLKELKSIKVENSVTKLAKLIEKALF